MNLGTLRGLMTIEVGQQIIVSEMILTECPICLTFYFTNATVKMKLEKKI